MRTARSALVGLVGAVAVAALIASCGGSDDDAMVTSSTEASSDTTDGTLTGGTTAATEAPVETDPPTTEAPSPDEGACLVGDWVVTEDQMNAYYAGLMGTLEAPLTIGTTGSAPLSFATDGSYEWAPGFALTVEVAGASGTGDVSGTITGKWSAVDGVVTTFSDLNALVVQITVNGVVFDGADLANGLLNSSPVNGVTYSCDGPSPVLDFQTADPAVTVPVTLTPA